MKNKLLDIAERVVSTYVYGLIIFLITANKFDISTATAAAWATLPAALSLAWNLLAPLIGDANFTNPLADLAKRVVITFAQAFIASSVAALHYDKSAATVALMAAVAAALAALKAGLASFVGDQSTAGFLSVSPGGTLSGPPGGGGGNAPQDVAA